MKQRDRVPLEAPAYGQRDDVLILEVHAPIAVFLKLADDFLRCSIVVLLVTRKHAIHHKQRILDVEM